MNIEDQRNSPSDPPPSGPKVLNGDQIIGKYRLVRDLGTGGMARVFLASLDGPDGFAKPYVLKRILPEYARDEQFAQMFAIEAKVASMLSHPNIVNVFEFAIEKDDYYLVLEYVAGASLDRIVHAARKQGVPLGAQVAVEIGLGLARALAYAHGLVLPNGTPLELVHRDISPGNVLVSYDGSVKLTDFGVVKTSVTATVAGVVKGKWSYMSPEQISSQPVDRRSDLFSLGVVLYELATGQRLFRGDFIRATALRVMKATVPPRGRLRRTSTFASKPFCSRCWRAILPLVTKPPTSCSPISRPSAPLGRTLARLLSAPWCARCFPTTARARVASFPSQTRVRG